MVLCMLLAGVSYALISSLAQVLGPAPPRLDRRTPVCHNLASAWAPQLDSASLRTSAALSGYAYAYSSAWRFS